MFNLHKKQGLIFLDIHVAQTFPIILLLKFDTSLFSIVSGIYFKIYGCGHIALIKGKQSV